MKLVDDLLIGEVDPELVFGKNHDPATLAGFYDQFARSILDPQNSLAKLGANIALEQLLMIDHLDGVNDGLHNSGTNSRLAVFCQDRRFNDSGQLQGYISTANLVANARGMDIGVLPHRPEVRTAFKGSKGTIVGQLVDLAKIEIEEDSEPGIVIPGVQEKVAYLATELEIMPVNPRFVAVLQVCMNGSLDPMAKELVDLANLNDERISAQQASSPETFVHFPNSIMS